VIAALLVISLLIPAEVYHPPDLNYHDKNYDVYQERPSRTATLLCGAQTREYYGYLVNWTLGFPHYYIYRKLGRLRTTIIVGDWNSFEKNLPFGCEILFSRELAHAHDTSLYSASLILKNLTRGTPDYEKLEPFFSFVSPPSKDSEFPKTNSTRVDVILTGPEAPELVWKPFLLVWVLVSILSVLGVANSWKRRKPFLLAFVVLLMLGAFFVGKVLYMKHENAEWDRNVASVLSLNGTGETCWPLVGVVNVPSDSNADSIPRALRLIRGSNSRLLGVRFEDYAVILRVGVSPENYENLAKMAENLGLGVDVESRSDVLEFLNEGWKGYREQREILATLEKYLPELPPAERKALESFIERQKGDLDSMEENLNASRNCYEMDVAIPTQHATLYYSSLSNFLAKLALLIVGIALVVGGRDGK